jgi:response regulator NasT
MVQASPQDPKPAAGSPRPAPGDQPSTILIAEDEHLLAQSLVQNVRALGFSVLGPAAHGAQALELARQERPDLALLDIRMPDMNGLEAGQVLYGQMGVPVICISAFTDREYVEAGARLGVFGYLLKPVTLDELRVTITIAWSCYRSHQRLDGTVHDLRQSLDNRKVLERAKGLVMKRLGLDEAEAMRRMQKQARDSRRKLVDLARAILETQDLFAAPQGPISADKSASSGI